MHINTHTQAYVIYVYVHLCANVCVCVFECACVHGVCECSIQSIMYTIMS